MGATRMPNMGFNIPFEAVPVEKLAGVHVQSVYYQIVSQDTSVSWDAVSIRQAYGRIVLDLEESPDIPDVSGLGDAGPGVL